MNFGISLSAHQLINHSHQLFSYKSVKENLPHKRIKVKHVGRFRQLAPIPKNRIVNTTFKDVVSNVTRSTKSINPYFVRNVHIDYFFLFLSNHLVSHLADNVSHSLSLPIMATISD